MKYKIRFLDSPGKYFQQEDIELPDGAIPLSTEVRARLDEADLPFYIWINDPYKGYKFYTRIYYLIPKKWTWNHIEESKTLTMKIMASWKGELWHIFDDGENAIASKNCRYCDCKNPVIKE